MPSGGKRPGAGRKRVTLSEKQLKALEAAFRKKAKETGKTVQDLLAELAYNCQAVEVVKYSAAGKEIRKIILEVPVKDRLRAMELFLSLTISKFSEQSVNIQQSAPTIGLPPLKDKPEEAFPTVAERAN